MEKVSRQLKSAQVSQHPTYCCALPRCKTQWQYSPIISYHAFLLCPMSKFHQSSGCNSNLFFSTTVHLTLISTNTLSVFLVSGVVQFLLPWVNLYNWETLGCKSQSNSLPFKAQIPFTSLLLLCLPNLCWLVYHSFPSTWQRHRTLTHWVQW